MQSSTLSYAKINLSLKILWKREDWYHFIDSVFQKISLADEMIFEDRNEWIEIRSEWQFRKIPTNSDNTCYKAALAMQKLAKWKQWIKITIYKNIPQKSGLWGWSSNAGEVFKYLNKYWNINLDKNQLIEIWKEIWADIPFFIEDFNCAKVWWIWEIISENENIYKWKYIALLKPKYIEVNTKWAYEEFDKVLSNNNSSINDFEQIIFPHFPDLQIIKDELAQAWALQANMTGSWSTIFWIFESKQSAQEAFDEIKERWWWGVFEIL